MEYAIYVNREDYKKVEAEERDNFIRSCLEDMGVNTLDIWPKEELTVENKIKLQNFLKKLDLEIIYDGDGGYMLYAGDDIFAEWFKPSYILREDSKAKTISKRFFYEVKIKCEKYYNTEEE